MPFQRHYLSREICADTFAIVLGETSQQEIVTQSCSIVHSRSKRRPTELTPEQLASIDNDPRIVKMTHRLQRMQPRCQEHKMANRKLRNAKQRMKMALWKKTREEWTAKQAVDDIKRQLAAKRSLRRQRTRHSVLSIRHKGKWLRRLRLPWSLRSRVSIGGKTGLSTQLSCTALWRKGEPHAVPR